jgi:hypothetical protein
VKTGTSALCLFRRPGSTLQNFKYDLINQIFYSDTDVNVNYAVLYGPVATFTTNESSCFVDYPDGSFANNVSTYSNYTVLQGNYVNVTCVLEFSFSGNYSSSTLIIGSNGLTQDESGGDIENGPHCLGECSVTVKDANCEPPQTVYIYSFILYLSGSFIIFSTCLLSSLDNVGVGMREMMSKFHFLKKIDTVGFFQFCNYLTEKPTRYKVGDFVYGFFAGEDLPSTDENLFFLKKTVIHITEEAVFLHDKKGRRDYLFSGRKRNLVNLKSYFHLLSQDYNRLCVNGEQNHHLTLDEIIKKSFEGQIIKKKKSVIDSVALGERENYLYKEIKSLSKFSPEFLLKIIEHNRIFFKKEGGDDSCCILASLGKTSLGKKPNHIGISIWRKYTSDLGHIADSVGVELKWRCHLNKSEAVKAVLEKESTLDIQDYKPNPKCIKVSMKMEKKRKCCLSKVGEVKDLDLARMKGVCEELESIETPLKIMESIKEFEKDYPENDESDFLYLEEPSKDLKDVLESYKLVERNISDVFRIASPYIRGGFYSLYESDLIKNVVNGKETIKLMLKGESANYRGETPKNLSKRDKEEAKSLVDTSKLCFSIASDFINPIFRRIISHLEEIEMCSAELTYIKKDPAKCINREILIENLMDLPRLIADKPIVKVVKSNPGVDSSKKGGGVGITGSDDEEVLSVCIKKECDQKQRSGGRRKNKKGASLLKTIKPYMCRNILKTYNENSVTKFMNPGAGAKVIGDIVKNENETERSVSKKASRYIWYSFERSLDLLMTEEGKEAMEKRLKKRDIMKKVQSLCRKKINEIKDFIEKWEYLYFKNKPSWDSEKALRIYLSFYKLKPKERKMGEKKEL